MRTVSIKNSTEIVKDATVPVFLIELTLGGQTLRYSTAGSVTWNAQTWSGSARLLTAPLQLDGGAAEAEIELTNTDESASALLLNNTLRRQPAKLWKLNGLPPYVVADAVQLLDGYIAGSDGISLRGARLTLRSGSGRLVPDDFILPPTYGYLVEPGTKVTIDGQEYVLEGGV